MVDFVYGRGDVMLYPSLPPDPRVAFASYSFSTTYMERGDHSGTDGKVETQGADRLRPASEYDLRKTVPLVTHEQAAALRSSLIQMPPFEALPVVSLHHKRVAGGLQSLATQGNSFVRGLRHQIAPTLEGGVQQYDRLVNAWLSDSSV